jgi:hypothetical protein
VCRIIGEANLEMRKIDLRLNPGCSLKAVFEAAILRWPDLTQEIRNWFYVESVYVTWGVGLGFMLSVLQAVVLK